MKPIISLLGLTILGACATSQLNLNPTEADAERAKAEFGNSSLTELVNGKNLYESNCGSCHRLYKPTDHSEGEWKHEVPEMVALVNKKNKKQVLSQEDERLILQYVLTMREAK